MMDLGVDPDFAHPEHRPGEPVRRRPAAPLFALLLTLRTLAIALAALLAAPLWPALLIGAAWRGWPPNIPRPADARRTLRQLWRPPTPPGLPRPDRLWLTATVARLTLLAPLGALAWWLDELLYGRALSAVPVRAPIFLISAARSGSTQLSRYIEADPRVVSPNLLQILMPYLWLWRIVAPTLGRLLGPDRVRALFAAALPAEFLERHEVDPLCTDTFEIGFYSRHLNRLAPFLGPEAFVDGFIIADETPASPWPWRETLVELIDRTGRKALLFADAGPEARLFIKGHFLAAADGLAARHPDARFVTVLRPPSARLRSMINFLWSNPLAPGIGKPPWRWLVAGLARGEARYNAAERDWYTRAAGPRRLVLRFADYVADLEGTLRRVYAACFDDPSPPAAVPRVHAERVRSRYAVDRSLPDLGIDGAAYDAAQPTCTAWIRSGEPG